MKTVDLKEDESLKQVLQDISPADERLDWVNNIAEMIDYVAKADMTQRKSLAFHEKIWEENPVSAIGMGTVDVRPAIEDPEFRAWFAEELNRPLPDNKEARASHLVGLNNKIQEQLKSRCSRVAKMKIFRVFAIFYPRYFSTITYWKMALDCHRAFFGHK